VIFRSPRELRVTARAEIDNFHRRSLGKQTINQMGADKTAPPGDHHFFFRPEAHGLSGT
jgi:hypothetical protein